MVEKDQSKVTKSIAGRIFNCLQYEVNPQTGVNLNFTEQNIKDCVNHKTITRYAYVCHDKDPVTEVDIENEKNMWTQADLGKIKGIHWHTVLETANNQTTVKTIAKWLGIPESMIDLPKGRGAFIDCVEYLRHSDIKQTLNGKYEYDASAIMSNFDWETEVRDLVLRKTKYEKPLSQKDFLKNEVLYNGMRIAEVIDKHPTLYMQEITVFQKLRSEYIAQFALLPAYRVNYYISGMSGYGKDTMARSLARSLYPDGKCDDDIFFEIGGKKVTFDGYDGQPVIIWSEFRSNTFVEALGGYENVLSAIDVIPKNNRQHKKFGSVKLINTINIVTSTESYKHFLNNLIDEADPDKTQSNRRFPIIIPIHIDDFDVMINTGYLDAADYSDYSTFKNIKGSIGKLAKNLAGSRPEIFETNSQKLIAPVMEAHQTIMDCVGNNEYSGMTDDEIVAKLDSEGFGTVTNYEELLEQAITEHEALIIEKIEAELEIMDDENERNVVIEAVISAHKKKINDPGYISESAIKYDLKDRKY